MLMTAEENAYAKINLGLDVLRRRADGYHELRMVMQTVGLCDRVFLSRTEEPGIRLSADRAGVPEDERNLAWRAAARLFEAYRLPGGLEIRLEKHIPAAAGLAGGSADAAAVLRAMDRMYGIGMTEEEICAHALTLGADVPFCVLGGTMLAEGIGERLTRLPDLPDCSIVILKPDFDCYTKEIYGGLAVSEAPAEAHPDMDSIVRALKERDLGKAAPFMKNILERPALKLHPEIAGIREDLAAAGAVAALMSGSGSAVFGLFMNAAQAEGCLRLLREKYGGAAEMILLTAPAGTLFPPGTTESEE